MNTTIEDFKNAEEKLFRETGTKVRSKILDMHVPALGIKRVRILEAGPQGARPMVMIHGGNSVAAGWEPLLSLLQNDFHIYAPDRPGCGLTDKLDYRGIPFREHALAFVGGVLDELNLPKATLIGNSMGGYWSLLYAQAHPERVERLVLIGEPAGSSRDPSFRFRLLGTPGINRLLFASVLKPDRKRTRKQLRPIVAHPERVPEAFLDLTYAASRLPGARLGWLSMVERVVPLGRKMEGTYTLRPKLPGIRIPTLFIWGERDFCDPRWGKELCALMPRADLQIVHEAGHLAWLDAPQDVAGLVRNFLLDDERHAAKV